jgi:hypothetical protein
MSTDEGDYEIDLAVDLAALKLAHADGSACTCKGGHALTVSIDLEEHMLHRDDECEVPALTAAAVQRLHEEAHPKGTLFAEYCPELTCREALSESS